MTTNSGWRVSDSGTVQHAGAAGRPFAGIWWLLVLRGAIAILFGLIAMFAPSAAMLSLLLVFAAYALVDGAFGLISAIMAGRRGESWGLLLLEGLANIAAAVVVLLWPAITVIVFVLLVAVWALISGGLMIGAAISHRNGGRFWLAIGGAASVLFGIVLALAPLIGAVVLTWWLGIYALIFGVALAVFGLRLRAITAG